MPACLPEQFCRIRSLRPPARRTSAAAGSYSGSDGVLRSADSSSPAPARMRRTPSMCAGSPLWLAQTRASSSGGTSSPSSTMAAACSGLLAERP